MPLRTIDFEFGVTHHKSLRLCEIRRWELQYHWEKTCWAAQLIVNALDVFPELSSTEFVLDAGHILRLSRRLYNFDPRGYIAPAKHGSDLQPRLVQRHRYLDAGSDLRCRPPGLNRNSKASLNRDVAGVTGAREHTQLVPVLLLHAAATIASGRRRWTRKGVYCFPTFFVVNRFVVIYLAAGKAPKCVGSLF